MFVKRHAHKLLKTSFYVVFLLFLFVSSTGVVESDVCLRSFIKYGVKSQFQFLTMPREGYVKFRYQQITIILFE